MNSYYSVTIKKMSNDKKYTVMIEMKGRVKSQFETLQRRVAILRAIEKVAHKLSKDNPDGFYNAADHVYRKSRGYDAFVQNLKTDLNIKVKAKAI